MKFRVVLTGAPCSGKTTTLNALKEKLKGNTSYHFIDEIATRYIHEQQKSGIDPFANLIKFERTVITQQTAEEDAVSENDSCTILDRSILDDLAITEMLEVGKSEHIDVAKEIETVAMTRHYDLVFILDQLPFEKTVDRREKDAADAARQDKYIRSTYAKFYNQLGYDIITVPVMPVNSRVDFILNEVQKLQTKSFQSSNLPISKIGMFGSSQLQDTNNVVESQPAESILKSQAPDHSVSLSRQ